MRRRTAAGTLGYGVLAVSYVTGALVTWTILGAPPFDPESGALTMAWMMGLLLTSIAAGLAGGWVCRRVGRDRQSVAVMVAILVGLAAIVVLIDMLIGPTPSGRAFAEKLLGPLPKGLPFMELLDGRPQPWFAVSSYVAAILAIFAGSGIAEKIEGS